MFKHWYVRLIIALVIIFTISSIFFVGYCSDNVGTYNMIIENSLPESSVSPTKFTFNLDNTANNFIYNYTLAAQDIILSSIKNFDNKKITRPELDTKLYELNQSYISVTNKLFNDGFLSKKNVIEVKDSVFKINSIINSIVYGKDVDYKIIEDNLSIPQFGEKNEILYNKIQSSLNGFSF